MAIVQGLLALATRSAGKVLNTVFGWATALLFGKVSEDRQIYLSIMTFGSVAWLVLAIGVAFPAVGAWLLAFAPLPDWVNHNWVRLFMLIGALVVPLIVGMVGLKMIEPEEKPSDLKGKVVTILKGYPYTLGLALTLVMMLVFAPFLKLPLMAKRWESQHVPMIVEAQDYETVVNLIQSKLKEAGWDLQREPASWMLKAPTKVLTTLAGGSLEKMIANNLAVLRSKEAEVVVHPSDLVLSGPKTLLPHLRAVAAVELAFSPAHLTWTKEANELEDKLEALFVAVGHQETLNRQEVRTRLDEFDRELKKLEISFEEWEVLSRQKLLVESYLFRKSDQEHGARTITPAVDPVIATSVPAVAKTEQPRGTTVVQALQTAFAVFTAVREWREKRAERRRQKQIQKLAAQHRIGARV